MDNVLVLVGEKGYRKSTFVRELFGAEWTLDSHIDLANKDGLAILEGAWGAELSELAGVRKVDKETMKSYLRQRVDKFRPAYQPRPITRPRQIVFVGTANPGPFLQEEDRVFWILKILQKIDTLELRRLRDQIWAEAKTAEARGEPHWFEDDSETASLREEHIESDVWEEDILEYMAHRSARVSIRDILDAKLKMDLKDCSAQDYRRVATILRRIGCKTVQVRGRAVWWLPDELKTLQ
jgi:predicted P-loop ATPase